MDNQLLRPRRRQRRASCCQFPEDIVMEILSRLPAKDVLKYQLVCRRWKGLTSTQRFSQMHRKNSSIPMILVQEQTRDRRDNSFLVDVTRKRARTSRVLFNSPCYMEFSCDGLMLLRGESAYHYIVLNPITREKVEISTPVLQVEACGMFFHPLVEAYCILWRFYSQSTQFKMLILGAEPCWRELSTGSTVSELTKIGGTSPVVVDDILYWLAFDLSHNLNLCVIAFDMKIEEISLRPQPDQDERRNLSTRYLMQTNGHLSLVEMCQTKDSLDIHIWILKDYASGLWTKSYTINTEVYIEGLGTLLDFQPIAVVNEELILVQREVCKHQLGYRLVAYNVEEGTRRNLRKKRAGFIVKASAHVPSLVSMKNWKSEILMLNRM